MSTVVVHEAQAFSESDPVNPSARIVWGKGKFYVTTILGDQTQELPPFDTYDDAVVAALAHADAIDATEVTDKVTRLELAQIIKAKDARIAELEAQLRQVAAVDVKK